jgi:hypothetical protein
MVVMRSRLPKMPPCFTIGRRLSSLTVVSLTACVACSRDWRSVVSSVNITAKALEMVAL